MSDLVQNPDARFSHVVAHFLILSGISDYVKSKSWLSMKAKDIREVGHLWPSCFDEKGNKYANETVTKKKKK